MEQDETARWELLGDGCGVWVTRTHCLTTDTLLLAAFSQPGPGKACADLGAGCGAVSLLWSARGKPGPVLAVELQKDAAALAAQSVRDNGFSHIRVVCGDVRDHRTFLPREGLDLIACNPPYYPLGSGAAGTGPRGIARHEETLSLADLAAAGKWGLKWGGRLCLCLPVERLPEAMEVFRQNQLEPKRLRLVQPGEEKPPYLFLLECRRGGRPGLLAEPVLCLTDSAGRPTPGLLSMYGNYRLERKEG